MATRAYKKFQHGPDVARPIDQLQRLIEFAEQHVTDHTAAIGYSIHSDGSVSTWATERAIRELERGGYQA